MQCNNELKVGLYPKVLHLCVYPHVNDVKTLTFCNGTKYGKYHSNINYTLIKKGIHVLRIFYYYYIGTVIQKTKELFNVSTSDECRLWGYIMPYYTLVDLYSTIDFSDFTKEQMVRIIIYI